LKEIHNKDKAKKNTLQEDIKKWKETYKSSFSAFVTTEKHKSDLFIALYTCSPKFMSCIFNILKSPGPVLVYSNYVQMEGLQIFKIYLNFFGFNDYHRDSQMNFNDLLKNYELIINIIDLR
jgi:hypothetical protein